MNWDVLWLVMSERLRHRRSPFILVGKDSDGPGLSLRLRKVRGYRSFSEHFGRSGDSQESSESESSSDERIGRLRAEGIGDEKSDSTKFEPQSNEKMSHLIEKTGRAWIYCLIVALRLIFTALLAGGRRLFDFIARPMQKNRIFNAKKVDDLPTLSVGLGNLALISRRKPPGRPLKVATKEGEFFVLARPFLPEFLAAASRNFRLLCVSELDQIITSALLEVLDPTKRISSTHSSGENLTKSVEGSVGKSLVLSHRAEMISDPETFVPLSPYKGGRGDRKLLRCASALVTPISDLAEIARKIRTELARQQVEESDDEAHGNLSS